MFTLFHIWKDTNIERVNEACLANHLCVLSCSPFFLVVAVIVDKYIYIKVVSSFWVWPVRPVICYSKVHKIDIDFFF